MQDNQPENMINQIPGYAKQRNDVAGQLAGLVPGHEPPKPGRARYGLAQRTVFGHHRAECSESRVERRRGIVQPTTSYEMDAVMDFAFSETQQHWYDAAMRFAREELVDPDAASREKRGEFWREGYQRCARFGILGLPVPVEYGGQGQDLATTVAAVEGLGYGCADTGLIFGIGASIWTVTMPILAFGTEAQKKRYLPGLCDGRLLGANAASEPGAGSDIFGMETRAVRHGDGWILNGRKTWITSGAIADLVVCFASTDPSKGVLGITAFLVERETPRISGGPPDREPGLAHRPHGRAGLRELCAPRR